MCFVKANLLFSALRNSFHDVPVNRLSHNFSYADVKVEIGFAKLFGIRNLILEGGMLPNEVLRTMMSHLIQTMEVYLRIQKVLALMCMLKREFSDRAQRPTKKLPEDPISQVYWLDLWSSH